MSVESDQGKPEADQATREAAVKDAANDGRVNAAVVGVISAGGSVAGGVLLGSAVLGPVGAALGGLIGAGAAYAAFRDLVKDKQPPTKTSGNTDTPVGNH